MGATFSLISAVTFKLYGGNDHCLRRLRTYTGEPLKTREGVMVVVRHHDQEKILQFLVVPGDVASLLGRDWMGKIRLYLKEVHKLHSIKLPIDLFSWFPERLAMT